MSTLATIHGIVARDLRRATRQPSRLLGGIARPFVWLLLVAAGFNRIATVGADLTYQQFAYPGVLVMAVLFGGALTAISTVYDREFGMLRLMLASPAGPAVVLAGRTIAATAVGLLQGVIVLGAAPFVVHAGPGQLARALLALAAGALVSALLGLLVAARLRSVENFAGVINVLLFPLLFISGALYPTAHLPGPLGFVARVNPLTHFVELLRRTFGQPVEFSLATNVAALAAWAAAAFLLAALLFDPEQRFIGPARRGARG